MRTFQGAIVLFEVGDFTFEMLRGPVGFAFIPFFCGVAIVLAMLWLTRKINQREYLDRPRPDYASIAAMEREVYGRQFEHDGAPAVTSQRWDGCHVHPDTTEPATRAQYAAWLEGYIKRGGKPTHFYDYPFSRAGFRYAASTLTVDSDHEFGASSRMIVVARNVTTHRTNPAGSFGGWAHTKLFFMHGYRTNDNIVPVYSDPEFDFARSDDLDHRPNLRWN